MNYNIPKEELKECLSTYLFKLSKFEKGIDNNSELLKEFKDVANIEQANIFIDINNYHITRQLLTKRCRV